MSRVMGVSRFLISGCRSPAHLKLLLNLRHPYRLLRASQICLPVNPMARSLAHRPRPALRANRQFDRVCFRPCRTPIPQMILRFAKFRTVDQAAAYPVDRFAVITNTQTLFQAKPDMRLHYVCDGWADVIMYRM